MYVQGKMRETKKEKEDIGKKNERWNATEKERKEERASGTEEINSFLAGASCHLTNGP